jgi:hypothetical protein
MMEKAEEENKKIKVKILYKYYTTSITAIQYEKDPDMDGNTLFSIERQGTITKRYKDLKETNTTKRTILRPNKHKRNREGEIETNTHTRHRTQKHTNTARPVGKRGNIHGKRTNNTIRIPKIRDINKYRQF